MRRSHRRWHAMIWPVLGPVILIAAYVALQAKQETPVENQQPGKMETTAFPSREGDAL